MTNDTSRPSASGITEPTAPEADGHRAMTDGSPPESGSPASTPDPTRARSAAADLDEMIRAAYPSYRVIDFGGRSGRLRAWREEARFSLWDLVARVKHFVGIHTWVPTEEWDTERGTIQFIGDQCWMCGRQA